MLTEFATPKFYSWRNSRKDC